MIDRLLDRDGVIRRGRPGCVILLIDQSGDMAELASVGALTASRATLAAEAANRALLALIRMSTAPGGTVDHCFDVSVLLHGGPAGVRPGLNDTITGARVQAIGALSAQPLATARRRSGGPAGADPAGMAAAEEIDVPIWVRPAAEGEPRADEALTAAADLARRWRRAHPASPAPVILTLGGGALARADGGPGARALERLAAPGGQALVLHGLYNDEAGEAVVCPADPAELGGDAAARWLFERSSLAPEAARRRAAREGVTLPRGARGLSRNADPAILLEWLLAARVRPRALGQGWFAFRRPAPAVSVARIAWGGDEGLAWPARTWPARIWRASDARFEASGCVLQKEGNPPRDCEDAVTANLAAGRFCVTDGAGEGVFSRLWARTLAMGWAYGGEIPGDDDALRAGVKSLDAILRQRIGRRRERLKDRQNGRLYWFQADERVSEYAAFVGLAFDPAGEWRALAVGDCCLFIERGDAFRSFPLETPDQFRGGAYLVPSAIDEDARIVDHVRRLGGERRAGDLFLLMSDAIACWYLSHPDRRPRLRDLMATGDGQGLGALIARERRSRRLRNDDIAILLVRITSEF